MAYGRQERYDEARGILQRTATEVTRNSENWRSFLISAANIYKYGFQDRLMIYAQKPDATACAEFDIWSGRMGRYVNRGTKGIMLLNEEQPGQLRYVFDVSDTHAARGTNSRMPYKWIITDENTKAVKDRLMSSYDITESDSLAGTLRKAARSAVSESFGDIIAEVPVPGSFLESVSEDVFVMSVRDTVEYSVEYILLTRCGLDADRYITAEDLSGICDFNTLDSICGLGSAVSDISEQILRTVEKEVKAYDLSRKRDSFNRIEAKGRLVKDARQADTAARQLAAERTREQRTQTREPEQTATAEPTAKPEQRKQAPPRGQMSLDDIISPVATDTVDEILKTGANTDDSLLTICAEYTKGKSPTETTEFLKRHYMNQTGTNAVGKGLITDGGKTAVYYSDEGLRIAKGSTAYERGELVTWSDADARIRKMLREGSFVSNDTLAAVPFHERSQAAAALWFMLHDLNEDRHPELGRFKGDWFRGNGFPESTAKMSTMLADRDNLQRLTSMTEELERMYAENKDVMRFNQYTPDKVLPRLHDLALSRIPYRGDNYTPDNIGRFLSDDEINNILMREHVENSTTNIYRYFREHDSVTDRANYVKEVYGTGGFMDMGYDENHDAKGMTISYPNADTVKLTWKNAAERIADLIADNRYIDNYEIIDSIDSLEKPSGEITEVPLRENAPTVEPTEESAPAESESAYDGLYGEYIAVKEARPDDIVLFRVGDFFEMFGEDAKAAADILDIHLGQREIKDVGKVDFCGVPAFTLEANIEKLRDKYDVTVSAIDEKTGSRGVYSLPSVDHEAERDIDAGEAEYGADGWRYFRDIEAEQEQSDVGGLIAQQEDSDASQPAEQFNKVQKAAIEAGKRYELLPMQDKIDLIAPSFGAATGTITTSPCYGKWRGTSDIHIKFDNGVSFALGNALTPKAKTKTVQNEFVNSAVREYAPEVIRAAKAEAIIALRKLEVRDNAIAAEKGLKPYKVLNVEFNDGTTDDHYLGWYYVTLAVDGKIHGFMETRLNYAVKDGKWDDYLSRPGKYHIAGALDEADVDFVFNNVGHSTIGSLNKTTDLSEEVRERAEKALAEREREEQETGVPDETKRTDDVTESVRDYADTYRLLSRLQQDCEYFLGAGQRSEKHLWAGNVQDQIAKMRELYEQLPEKPEWLSQTDIDRYAESMLPDEARAAERGENSIEFSIGFTESGLLRDFKANNPDMSFALGNAVLGYLDEIYPIDSGYDKTDFTIMCTVDGEPWEYTGRYDIGDRDGTLSKHIRLSCEGLINSTYATNEDKENAQRCLDILVPYLEANSWLTEKEQRIFDEFKEQNPAVFRENSVTDEIERVADEPTLVSEISDGAQSGDPTVQIVDEPTQDIDTHQYPQFQSSDPLRHLVQNAEPTLDAPTNFRITDDNIGHGTQGEKYRANIAAIRTLKAIESEGRYATPDEQETLSRYVGWGGLAECFKEGSSHYDELKGLLTEDEYNAARESTLTAFYTPPVVIDAIYTAIGNMGFTTGNILDPAAGIGHFEGMLPESMSGSKLYGVELDSISGRIAKQLYPNADIRVQGFEQTDLPDNMFDIAVGNVPFGDIKVYDPKYDKYNFNIHDYFVAKSLDKVRAGGVVAVVVSKGLMDKSNPSVRGYLAQRAELLGAIRLPNDTFKANAGTEVVSDIIFLQKRDRIVEGTQDWVYLGKTENGLSVNQYFVDHPEMVLGTLEKGVNMYGGEDVLCLPNKDIPLSEQLEAAVRNIDAVIPAPTLDEVSELSETAAKTVPADPNVRNYSYTEVDGDIYYRENSVMKQQELSGLAESRVRGMIGIRDCLRELIGMEMSDTPDSEIHAQQQKLNDMYDSFSDSYGLINSTANKRAFSDDASYTLIASLEVLDEDGKFKCKADMFTKRTIRQKTQIDHVDTAAEALAVSMGERGCVDMEYMSKLSGMDEERLADELTGYIYKNPETMRYETSDEYLSGNIREKLRAAQAAAVYYPSFADNVKSLEAVIPEPLKAGDISVRLGAAWIEPKYIDQFIYETLGTPWYARGRINTEYSEYTSEWRISEKSYDSSNIKANMTYGTSRVNAYQLIENSLNLRTTKVYDYDAMNDKRVLNQKETTLAQQKQGQLEDAFKEWIFQDPQRRNELVTLYNEKFNSIRPREYDGSNLVFPGMTPEISLRKHQLDAIAHTIYGKNTLLAHEVGAGKTFEMIASAMESKRLGLCSKSLFVVPNHLTEQMGADVLRLYPAANVLVATRKDFTKENRRRLCSKIATGDFDIVIIGHSQLEKIPISQERQEQFLRNQIDDISNGIAEMQYKRGAQWSVKQMQKTKKNLEAKLQKLTGSQKRDDVVTFEELGIDRMYVDEAHGFKNLYFYTKMNNVAGISQSEAQKSSDMLMKCRYIDELTGGRGVTFATATAVSNSMVEVYTMMRYLQSDTLNKMGWQHFDRWAATFGETTTAIELAPEGTGYRAKTRFSKFYNLPELMSVFKECADIKTADVLNLPVPKANYHNVVAEPTEIQKDMVNSLAERAQKIHNGSVTPSDDNMLCITNDGRKIGLDQRLMNPMLPDEPGTKVNLCVDNVYKIWSETAGKRSTQLIFCDFSTPKGDGSFNLYDDIRDKLVSRGVPKEEIAFIHEAKTEAQKKSLYQKMESGSVRVMIGSTAKCGTGMNVQNKLIALHDLDCPWRPADLQQRMGRIVRQGNHNPEVDIFRYVTNATFDAYLWQTIENKQRFISQILTSKAPVRACEDADEATLSYAEVKALCAGDERIKEKMDLDIEVSKLKLMKSEHVNEQYSLQDLAGIQIPAKLEAAHKRLKGYEADLKTLRAQPQTDDFPPMVINGVTYTEKDKAGKAIIEACQGMKPNESKELGTYRGFGMRLDFVSTFKDSAFAVTMHGKMNYTAPLGTDVFGNITRINNRLESIEQHVSNEHAVIEGLDKQRETALSEIGKPFEHEDELTAKTARLALLNAELNLDTPNDRTDAERGTEERIAETPGKREAGIDRDTPQARVTSIDRDAPRKPSVLAKLKHNREQIARQTTAPKQEKGKEL